MPPTVTLSFAPNLVVLSPDTVRGTLFAFDGDGLAEVRLSIATGDSSLSLDSQLTLRDAFQLDHSLAIEVPPGVPAGTALRVIGTAEDFVGFFAADTVVLFVQDSGSGAVRRPIANRLKPL